MPEEAMESYDGLSDRAGSPSMHMDQEKRMRREIANSNERRRMQSINAGFQSLRALLPHHQDEKLSKAAILQQTAEYIYTLEQEKTRLLSQNCQLKRIINQHDGEASSATKKRKTDSGPVTVVPAPISESSDEGIGSMSPEPVGMGASAGTTVPSTEQETATEMLRRELMDLRLHLDQERRVRLVLEDQVKSLETQLYPDRNQIQQYQHEVASWPEDPPLEEELYPELKQDSDLSHPLLHQPVVEREGPPPRRESQCSSHSSSRLFKDEVDGPVIQSSAIVAGPSLLFSSDSAEAPPLPPLPMSVAASPCPSPVQTVMLGPVSPAIETRIPSVLEAAIKAEPKVEVERLPSPSSVTDESTQARLYINTSRQNLETIVEAIRHLEGDHLFSDDPSPHRQVLPSSAVTTTTLSTEVVAVSEERLQDCSNNEAQEMPLALITTPRALPQQVADQRILKMKVDPFSYQRAALQQQRPGVIVVKQHT